MWGVKQWRNCANPPEKVPTITGHRLGVPDLNDKLTKLSKSILILEIKAIPLGQQVVQIRGNLPPLQACTGSCLVLRHASPAFFKGAEIGELGPPGAV